MDTKDIAEAIEGYFTFYRTPDPQPIIIMTGVGGMDMFQEALENTTGYSRVYFPGNKVLRILRKLKPPIKKSITGNFYKLVKNGNSVLYCNEESV